MGSCLCKGVISSLVAGLTLFVVQPSVCQGQTANFVPPPRNIADITSILDQEKPDPTKLAKMTAEAEAQAPPGVNGRACRISTTSAHRRAACSAARRAQSRTAN
jgi:hypothetical protein